MNFRTLLMLGVAALIIVVAVKMNNSPEGLSNTLPAANNEGGYAVEPTDSTTQEHVADEDTTFEENVEETVEDAVDAASEMTDDTVEAIDDAADAVVEHTEDAVDTTDEAVEEVLEEVQEPRTE